MSVWDVKSADGNMVTTLAGLATALHTTPVGAANRLLGDNALAAAAPAELLAEAKAARKKPGDGTPPPISNGSFVSWKGGKGRVDLLVSRGKVPGVEGDVEGTADSPAARVVVWKNGKPTREKIGVSTHVLKRIAPLDKPEGEKKSDPAAALVAALSAHESLCSSLSLPDHARVTGAAISEVYGRGVKSYPEGRTTLSAQEWAMGRVQHFVKVAGGQVATVDAAGHDRDLLHEEHPLADNDHVAVSLADVEAQVKAFHDFL